MDMKKIFLLSLVMLAIVIGQSHTAYAEWNVDLSRRQKTVQSKDMQEIRKPASTEERSFVDVIFQSGEPLQEIVVLNTDKGFVPSTVRVRQGLKYKIHVVNVNEKEKNVSFVLDSFGEHHATYYGKVKSFYLEPKKEGVYSFECPETSSEGRMIVLAAPGAQNIRVPATATEELK
jgi:hypothetical protein